MESAALEGLHTALPYFLKHKTLWASYDGEADVLYLQLKKPNHADDSHMTEDEIIIRYEGNEVVGMTILNASKRMNTID